MADGKGEREAQPISDPNYWKDRLRRALHRDKLHHAIFLCTKDLWKEIEAKHREILARVILPNESVLDAGCGWGRLLTLMPKGWSGDYLGIDLSPDFIAMARDDHPERQFICAPLEIALPQVQKRIDAYVGPDSKFDWCVLVSIKNMVIGNEGRAAWDEIEGMIRKVANRLLILEYSPQDDGTIEVLT